MKVLLQNNLQATTVEREKRFYPAIDDGEKIYYFNNSIYGNKEIALNHAEQLIANLQRLLNQTIENWHMNVVK